MPSSEPPKQQHGRLVVTTVGDELVVLYAAVDTMDGALKVASVPASLALAVPDLRPKLMELARFAVNELMHKQSGQLPQWGEPRPLTVPAPAGRA